MSEFMKAGDPVRVVLYDGNRPDRFQRLAQPLRQALQRRAQRLSHINSSFIEWEDSRNVGTTPVHPEL